MLLEQAVLGFREVGENSLEEIKNTCLVDFAYKLKSLIVEVCYQAEREKQDIGYGIYMYKVFNDKYSSNIKYNTKSIIFEETINNNKDQAWSVRGCCEDVYDLQWNPDTEEHSGFYTLRHSGIHQTDKNCCERAVNENEMLEYGKTREWTDRLLTNFYEFFGRGEFPFITITIIRLGNKEHYFYRIHR